MSRPAIRIEGLWKQYTIGQKADASATFYDMISNAISAPFRPRNARSSAPDLQLAKSFWALKDINFDVASGEVVGILGRNGAGKSTLLKVLSRITAPTRGRVEVRGRIASLLEVGTGFHPELSGRENIYLNGAILGMTRRDIARKFDEIVAFAEVEEFIDTPVKRFSSGMYVRLAFAVAAHLEPDVLIVDEVLAVGDAAFQRKCLGSLRSIAGRGKTVLLVSHSVQSIRLLCNRAICLHDGEVRFEGPADQVVSRYTAESAPNGGHKWMPPVAVGNEALCLDHIFVRPEHGAGPDVFSSGESLVVEIGLTIREQIDDLCVGFDLLDLNGSVVFRAYNTDQVIFADNSLGCGQAVLCCIIPAGLLNCGHYQIAPRIGVHNRYWIVDGDPVLVFSVQLTHGRSRMWSSIGNGGRPGVIAPILKWTRSPQMLETTGLGIAPGNDFDQLRGNCEPI